MPRETLIGAQITCHLEPRSRPSLAVATMPTSVCQASIIDAMASMFVLKVESAVISAD